MIRIRFIATDQSHQDIETATDQSLMKAAVDANVKGIEADCGGTLTCATCHVMIDAPWSALLPAPVPDELDMLDFASSPVVPMTCTARACAATASLIATRRGAAPQTNTPGPRPVRAREGIGVVLAAAVGFAEGCVP